MLSHTGPRGRSGTLTVVSSTLTAGLFPGQGSQTADMRELVAAVAPELLHSCIELVGEDPFARVADSTRFAQPAIFCASVAGWMRRREQVHARVFAGHSLGELSALVAAGALDARSGLELAVRRGELMARAGSHEEEGMLAVLKTSLEHVQRLADEHDVSLANDNAPGQAVLAGALSGLRDVSAQARKEGARAIWLDVTGAFHSPAMGVAVEPFRALLDEVEVRATEATVISCASARPFVDVRAELAGAIVKPVRWRETMLALADMGVSAYADLGPGTVLAKLVERNLPGTPVLTEPEPDVEVVVGSSDAA